MQSDETKRGASAAYLVTDESCSARVGGRHDCAASALFSPIAQKKAEPSSPQPVVTGGEREGGALSLSASQLTLLRCLNSHFLYKIDALTAALVCTRPHTGTVQWVSSASSQPSCQKRSFPLVSCTVSPLLSPPLLLSSESPHHAKKSHACLSSIKTLSSFFPPMHSS